MSFDDLPDELLVEVVKYLHPVPGPQFDRAHWGLLAESESHDICQLANTSTRLYNIARPRLYSTFIQNGSEGLVLFVRTLLSRPDLAQYVQYVNIVPGRDDFDFKNIDTYNNKEIECLSRTMDTCRKDCLFGWSAEVESGGWQSFVALLLYSTPKVQEIHVPDLGKLKQENLWPVLSILQRASFLQIREAPPANKLQHLHQVSIGWDRGIPKDPSNDWGSTDIKHVLPYLTVPSVTSFHGIELRTDPVSPDSWVTSQGLYVAENITNLKLIRCNIARETLREFLRPFCVLENFFYEEGGVTVGPYDCDPHGFIDAMPHLKHTLQSFTFHNQLTQNDSQLARETLGSFADFTKLHTIDTMSFSLLPSRFSERDIPKEDRLRLGSILPRSLRSLTIRDFERRLHITEHVLHLIRNRRSHMPDLKLVVLETKGPTFESKTGFIKYMILGLKSSKIKPKFVMETIPGRSPRTRIVIEC